MAIYRTGQASMDAQGYITGYDTKWREQLTLIRPGATIVFLTQPLQVAVITEVINDTGMRAISTGGAVVNRSNYVILLHDSITVDGLAQDVAETLRYYQSKETIIEEAIEFFKDFDLKSLQNLVNQIKDAAEKTAADRAATEQLKNETNQIKSDTNTIKQQTQQIKDSALSEVNSARDQGVLAVNQTKDQSVSEMNQIKSDVSVLKNEAVSARDSAKQHMTDAQSAKNAAETAKAGAVTARNEAEEFAKSLNAENLLRKDANLSDLTDKNAAKSNLAVQGVFCTTSTDAGKFNQITSPDGNLSMFVANNGSWGVQSTTGESKPLAINRGGTGATSAEGARDKLETFRESKTALGETDLNTLTGAKSGVYYQAGNADATPERGYPERAAGTLMVLKNGANGADGCTQIYYPYNNRNRFHIRNCLAGNPNTWTEWATYNRPTNSPEFRASIGLGVNDKVQFSQVKAYGTNGVFADGVNLNLTGSSFMSRLYNSTNELVSQAEFRAGETSVQILNRSPGTSGGVAVWELDKAGRFFSPQGYTTAIGSDWNGVNSIVNRSIFISGETNAPIAKVTYGGIHVGFYDSFAMQIAARDNSFHGRCLENNSWKEWKKFALENNNTVNYAQSGSGTANDIQTTKAISFLSGSTTYNLPVAYGVLAAFGNGITPSSGGYVGQLCWNKTTGELFTRTRDDGQKVWRDWLKVTTAAISDESLKDVKGNLSVEGALDNVNRMEFKIFRYLNDSPDRSARRGVIAQQIRNIDREYTTKVGDKLHLDTTPMLLDGLAAIQALTKRDNENKERISKLESELEELKALVSVLINKQ